MLLNALLLSLGVALAAFVVGGVTILARKLLIKPSHSGRGLFVYFDGVNTRSIDPIAATLGMKDHPTFILERHLKLAYEGDEEAIKLTAQAVQEVFGVPAFTGPGKPGLTVTECYRLVVAFANFCDALKKNTNTSSTVQPSLDAMSRRSSEETPSDTMPSGSRANELAPA